MCSHLAVHRLTDDLRLGGFHEHHAEEHSDFARVKLLLCGILGNVLPQRVLLKVVRCIRGADADEMLFAAVLPAKGARFCLLECAHSLADLIHAQRIGCGDLAARALAARALDVVACTHRIPRDPFHDRAELLAQKLRAVGKHLLIGGLLQKVRNFNVSAVLAHLRLHGALRKGLSVRCHAFGELAHVLVDVEQVPPAEFHALSVVFGDAALLAVLRVHQAGARAFQKLAVKKSLVQAGAFHGVFRCVCDVCHYVVPLFLLFGGPFFSGRNNAV